MQAGGQKHNAGRHEQQKNAHAETLTTQECTTAHNSHTVYNGVNLRLQPEAKYCWRRPPLHYIGNQLAATV